MTVRPTTVKPTYRPIKIDELETIAKIYKTMITKPAVLPDFTAKDASVNNAWVTAFDGSIMAVGLIKKSSVIIKTNKDITKAIKDNSKKCVQYGKTLTYNLKKTFLPDEPGVIESFPIVQANDKMRLGETEGLLGHLETIIQQMLVRQAEMTTASAWDAQNLLDYQNLFTTVDDLNQQQENAKKLIPENTDAAVNTRNHCYAYMQTLITLKDIVYYDDLQKRHQWALATNLNQIRQ